MHDQHTTMSNAFEPAGVSARLRIDALEAGASAPADAGGRPVVELSDIRAWRFFRAAPQDFLEQYAPGFIIADVHLAQGFFTFALDFLVRRPEATLWIRERVSRRELLATVAAAREAGISCTVHQYATRRALKARLSPEGRVEALELRGQETYSTAAAGTPDAAKRRTLLAQLLAAGPEEDEKRFSAVRWTAFFKQLWYEDLASALRLRDRSSFFSFMKVLANHTSQALNWAEIAAQSGISAPTARDWTRHLESIGLCELIEPLTARPPRRAKLRPKLYWTTLGLALWLSDEMTSPGEVLSASLLENALFLALKDALPEARFMHFADTNHIVAPLVALVKADDGTVLEPFWCAADDAGKAAARKALKSLARASITDDAGALVVLNMTDASELLTVEAISIG